MKGPARSGCQAARPLVVAVALLPSDRLARVVVVDIQRRDLVPRARQRDAAELEARMRQHEREARAETSAHS